MAKSIIELYEKNIKPRPASERLRLATLILNDIPPHAVVDYSDAWTEEDLRDFSLASWRRAEGALGETPGA